MKKRKRKARFILGALGALALAVFSFFALTYVPDGNATVTGNVWVKEEEVRKLVFDSGFWCRNSLYLCKVQKSIVPGNAAFIDSIDIEFAGTNRVVLRVNENSPIGYVEQGDTDYYFDVHGVVLDVKKTDSPTKIVDEDAELAAAVSATSNAGDSIADADLYRDMTPTLVDLDGDGEPETDANGIWLADSDGDGTPDVTAGGVALVDINGDGRPDVTEEDVEQAREQKKAAAEAEEKRQKEEAERAAAGSRERGEAVRAESASGDGAASGSLTYEEALAELPLVSGLTDQKPVMGKKIKVRNDGIFNYIQALKKIINKFGIRPDYVSVENGTELSLHLGDVVVSLGPDNLLEDKISRMVSILPQLTGMKGTLHLETFTDETVNIVFEKEEARIARYKKKNNIADDTKKDDGDDDADASGENTGADDTGSAAWNDGNNQSGGTVPDAGSEQGDRYDSYDTDVQNADDSGQQWEDSTQNTDGSGGLVIEDGV
uniref:FG-GAP repeat domain-containing protein n=1 Tax=Eubacterium cellulosolvens TaxID=29322 RepID=UPI0004854AFD|nr:VCBS repeat-containing protein [[Eubacterium] cellulosolvens]